jgi:ATP-dependent Lon protease
MNPVILLDEIDKVGGEGGGKSSEVYGVLTHLLDETQNHLFQDLYLDEVPLDLSKALFITTFNDKSKIDPIVLNRIKVIDIKPLMLDEKINITKKFIIPEFCRANKLKVSIKDSLIEYIITRKTKTECGMRNIRQNFETLFNRLNTIQVLEKCGDAKEIHKDFSYKDLTFEKTNDYSLVVTKNIIDTILTGQTEDQPWMTMYI